EPAQSEHRRARERTFRPHMTAEPAESRRPGRPDGEDRIEVERLPGGHPRVEQELPRVKVAGLTLAEQRHPAIQAGKPAREPPALDLARKEVAVGEVDLGDVEVEESPAERDGVPEKGRDGKRPDGQRGEVARAPEPRA